jgi:recombinational DNA repair ATPase RecF
MSDLSVFRWVDIEGFRGFNRRQRINLDASAVIVVGPNGTGKTSFFDAIQWLLLGSLERLEKWRVRRNDEHIANRYRGSEPAVVEAELEIQGKRIHLRRQGRYDVGLLEWEADGVTARGEDAERKLSDALGARAGQDVRSLLMTSALLQQDVVREVLEDKPAERYRHLAALLGLDELGTFEAEARKRADRLSSAGKAARQALRDAEARVEMLGDRVTSQERDMQLAGDVRAARARVVDRLSAEDTTVRVSRVPTTSADAALAQQQAETLGRQLAELLRAAQDLEARRPQATPPAPTELAARQHAVAAARAVVEQAEREVAAARERLAEATARSSQLVALAAQAIDLLSDTCPVCGQDIDEHDLHQHLERRIEGAEEGNLNSLRQDVARRETELTAATTALTKSEAEFAPLAAAADRAKELEVDEQRWRGSMAALQPPQPAPLELVELASIHAGDVTALDRTVQALRVVWAALGDLAAVLRSDASDAQLLETRAQLRRAEEGVPPLREAAQLASKQEEDGKTVHSAATRAVTAVTEKRFRRLAPTVQDIYWRLDPHPSFTTLDFDLDVYRSRGIASPVVRDTSESVTADPLLVFSSSQANVTALSYFLALGWAAGHQAVPFVLLDDPLQSMDDVNTLGFADLCRHIRRHRQLVVSTHEARLGSLLARKLAPRLQDERTRLIEFKAWTRLGPEIDQRVVDSQAAEGEHRWLVPADAA